MLEAAKALRTFRGNLKECWGFDSMYTAPGNWIKFIQSNRGVKYTTWFSDEPRPQTVAGTKVNCLQLKALAKAKKLSQITVIASKASHNNMMKQHLATQLNATSFLK